jgi:hypothetical protein
MVRFLHPATQKGGVAAMSKLKLGGSAAIIAIALSVGSAAPAAASLATYNFTGDITQVDDGFTAFSVGETFSGSLTYNLDTPNTGDDVSGVYDGLTSLTFNIGGYTFSMTNPSGTFEVQVGNQGTNGTSTETTDRFSVLSDATNGLSGSIPGFTIGSIILRLDDSTGNLFSTDALPSDVTLADFDSNGVFVSFDAVVDPGISGELTAFAPAAIPEPGSLAILAGALAGMFVMTRRRRVG